MTDNVRKKLFDQAEKMGAMQLKYVGSFKTHLTETKDNSEDMKTDVYNISTYSKEEEEEFERDNIIPMIGPPRLILVENEQTIRIPDNDETYEILNLLDKDEKE